MIAFGLGDLFHFISSSSRSNLPNHPLREVGKFKFVSPLLACGDNSINSTSEYKTLESTIKQIISQKTEAGKITDASVYLRNPTGAWLGVNENTEYAPASLLKVPLMIAYYKLSESKPEILTQQLFYDGKKDDNASETFKNAHAITRGWYSVDDLITAMAGYSDNNATLILKKNMDPKMLTEVYNDLGLPVATNENPVAQSISAREYSYFFRVLYNATYVSPEHSEKALEILTGQDFPEGIQATVPSSVPISQKFGERSLLTPSGEVISRELHDCGIVYDTNATYLLCIMTRGRDFNDLVDVIQSIGKAAYQHIHTN